MKPHKFVLVREKILAKLVSLVVTCSIIGSLFAPAFVNTAHAFLIPETEIVSREKLIPKSRTPQLVNNLFLQPEDCITYNVNVLNPYFKDETLEACFNEDEQNPGQGELWLHSNATIAHIVHVIPDEGVENLNPISFISWGPDYWFLISDNVHLDVGERIKISFSRFGNSPEENFAAALSDLDLIAELLFTNSTPPPNLSNADALYRYGVDIPKVGDLITVIQCFDAFSSGSKLNVQTCLENVGEAAVTHEKMSESLNIMGGSSLTPNQIQGLINAFKVAGGLIQITQMIIEASHIYQDNDIWLIFPVNPDNQPPLPTPCPLCSDSSAFITDVTIPDGFEASPGETLIKTWRIRNMGTTTWGAGYQLSFLSGNPMGALSSVGLPHSVAPNETVDISVNITAPSSDGTYQGNWRMKNPNGTYFGDTVWVKIQVGNPSENIILTTDPSSPASTDQVRIYARVNDFPNLRAMRILVDGQQLCELGAAEIQECVWHTNGYPSGQHSISVEADDWTGSSWDNPERRTILYELTGSGSVNHAPFRPILVANPAYDWYVTIGNSPQLCAQDQGDPEGDPVTQYRFVASASVGTVDSGWVSGPCYSFGSINPGTYEWSAQVKDSNGGVSEWSDKWHFTVESSGIEAYIDHFSPNSPSFAEEVKIYGCTSGHAGVNITMRLLVNDANDGTDSGEWHIIKEQGSPCFNDVDAPIWRTLEYGDGPHLVRLVAWAIEPDAGDFYDTVYTLNHRRPDSPRLVAPVSRSGILTNAVYLNSRTVTFKWDPTIRAETYILHISTTPTPSSDSTPVFRQTFDASINEYSVTLEQDYGALYWQVEAINDVGSNKSGIQSIGIDRQIPLCTVSDLSSPSYESVFQVNWAGTDNLAGIRSFDIQFMDSERGTWESWLIDVSSTKIYDLFTGQPGHTYYFRCSASDTAANIGDYPSIADTSQTINPAARPPTPWWDESYSEKRNVTILNNMSGTSMPVGYPVRLHFDNSTTPTAAEIYNASLSTPKCNDLRIVANDSTELNRIVQNCTSTAIEVWFRSQASILGGASDNSTHQIYYGNASAGTPPADPNQVWYPYKESGTTYLYFFQEGSGYTAYDSSGNNRHCSINSTVQWSTSKFGYGLRFNRANYGDSRSLNCGSAIPLSAFTIEFWYKPDADDSGILAGQTAGGGNGGGGNNWMLKNEDGRIRLDTWACSTCGSYEVRSNFSLRDSKYVEKWNHIAVTFNGGNVVKFYINGALDSTKYLGASGINTFTPPLEIGSAEGYGQIKANMGTFRISSGVKSSFPYASFAKITNEPSIAVGQVILPTPTGSPDLVILNLSTYPNPAGGAIVEATVENQGNLSTQNGFYTDLYLDHLPTGAGDYSGSLQFWVNDPIAPEEIVTLTTTITDLGLLGSSSPMSTTQQDSSSIQETSGTLYAQADSVGVLDEPDEQNNIYSTGTSICLANHDLYEEDDDAASASNISIGEIQAHNFSILSDEDWIKFDAVAGSIYQIQTLALDVASDTYLYLYDMDGSTLLSSNDDTNDSLSSMINWTASTSGTYYLMVRHWNPNVGGCGTSYDIEIQELTEPSPPSGLEATAISEDQVDITWADNSDNEDSFELERSLDGSTGWTVVATLGANTTSCSDTGLSEGTTYYYRVRSYNTVGNSAYSNTASATTLSAPADPTSLSATAVSQSQIDLTWADNSNNEDGFELQRSLDRNTGWTLIATLGANVTSFSDIGLSSGTAYYYQVRSYNTIGNSVYSNTASATTNDPLTEYVVSGETPVAGSISGSYLDTNADDGLTETITEQEKLGKPSKRHSYLEHKWTFTLPSNGEATFYANAWMPLSSDGDNIVFAYSTDGINYTDMFTLLATSDGFGYESYTLPQGITGIVYIRVTDTDRNGGNLALDTLYVDHLFILADAAPAIPPDTPSELVANAISSNQIDLEWVDNSQNESGFEIERSLDGNTWEQITTVSANVTFFSDSGLVADTTYYYQVRAINDFGVSEYSTIASAKTPQPSTIQIHVGDLDSASFLEKNKWYATVSVTVHFQDHLPVQGATVAGFWNGDATMADSCVTDSNGVCSITLGRISTREANVTFTVTDVMNGSDIYMSANNHDEDGDSNGTTITIFMP